MKRFGMLLFLPVVVLSITLAGCGKAADKTKDDNARRQGGKPPASKSADKPAPPTAEETLRGTWKATLEGDEEKLKQSVKEELEADGTEVDQAVLDEAVKVGMKQFERMAMTIAFREDGTTEMTMIGTGSEPKVEKGTWEIVLVNKNIVKLKLAGEGESPDEVELAFSGPDEFTMKLPIPLPIKPPVFNRVP